MKFLEKLIKKTNTFQRTIGLSLEQFNHLVNRLNDDWLNAENQRKTHENRKRKIGAGHPYKLDSLKFKLLVVLLYYKLYLTQEFLGVIVGLDQANVSRLLKKMLPLIEKAADPELATYLDEAKKSFSRASKMDNFKDFFDKYPYLKEVATDATEQQCYRAKDDETQKHYYSGKKKKHTIKTQITISTTGKFLAISKSYGGSVHDKTIIDKEKTIQKLPKKTCHRLDSGYQGVKQDNPSHYIVLPTKKQKGKELSQLAKENNRINSKRRIIVEHGISRIKKFRICSDRYRGPIKSHNQIFRNVVSILNFKTNHTAMNM